MPVEGGGSSETNESTPSESDSERSLFRRREFMHAAAGTVGVASGMGTDIGAGSRDIALGKTILDESFEEYSTGSYPNNWTKNGNSDQQVVSGTASDGSNSLRISGSSDGCWEAIAVAPTPLPDSGTVEISVSAKPTTDGQVGCHDKRGSISLRTSDDSWNAGNGAGILTFGLDGRVKAPDGDDLGPYNADSWNRIEVTYERTDTGVTLSYTINGSSRGSFTRPVKDYENDLSYTRFTSGEFTVYYDDIGVVDVDEAGVGVKRRDYTGDGTDDLKVWNGEVWLLLDGTDMEGRTFVSRLGRDGGNNLGGPWWFKPTDRDSNGFVFQERELLETFQGSGYAGYHVMRRHTLDGTPFRETTTVYLPSGARAPVVRTNWVNLGSSTVTIDQEPGHIHDGIMLVKGVELRHRSGTYRFHAEGSGTHAFSNVYTWETFDLSGTYPYVTAFASEDAVTYGLIGGSTGARHAVTNGDPPRVIDFMVKAAEVGPDETVSWRLAVGAHAGGSDAPQRGAEVLSTAATHADELPPVPDPPGGDNDPPTAAFEYSPSNPRAGEQVSFDAGNSSDPDGSIVEYEWAFGDGTTATGEQVTHTYDSAGDYDAELTVIDDDGAIDTTSATVSVGSGASTPAFTVAPRTPYPGEEVQFDAGESSDDGSITAYEWTFGDGTTATGEQVTHTYDSVGDYEVSLTVTDDAGNTAETTKTVSVEQARNLSDTVVSEKLSQAKKVHEDSIVSVLDPLTDRELYPTVSRRTVRDLDTAVGNGTVTAAGGEEALRRLTAAEHATEDILEFIGPNQTNTELRFARRLSTNLGRVLIDLILSKISVSKKLIPFAPSWAKGYVKKTIEESLSSAITGLLGDWLNDDTARTETKAKARSAATDIWSRIQDGVTASELDDIVRAAIDGILDAVTGVVRGVVEFAAAAPVTTRVTVGSVDSFGDYMMGNSIYQGLFDLNAGLRPDGFDGGSPPGDFETARQARDRAVLTVRENLNQTVSMFESFRSTIGEIDIYESVTDLVRVDGPLDVGLQLISAVGGILLSFASTVLNVAATTSSALSLWLTRQVHLEVVQSFVAGEDRVAGWVQPSLGHPGVSGDG